MIVPSAHAGADDGPAPAAVDSSEASRCVEALTRGEANAEARLLELVQRELRPLARTFLRPERADRALQSTALLQEVWTRLIGPQRVSWLGRQHFFAVAARAMRRVLVEQARARRSERDEDEPPGSVRVESVRHQDEELFTRFDLLALDRGLGQLQRHSARAARIVELRCFGGLTPRETAETLGLSIATVTLEWRAAHAWLSSWMKRGDGA